MTNDSDEYTPTTDTIRAGYIDARYDRTPERVRAEFDRWLAAERAKWQAQAYELGRDHEYRYSVMQSGEVPTNPYRTT